MPYTAFAGEWLFSGALYGDRPEADAGYLDEILRRDWRFGDPDVARLLRMRPLVRPFLESCLEQIPWDEYTLVGFTSTFQQNIASLALARLVKQALLVDHDRLRWARTGRRRWARRSSASSRSSTSPSRARPI